jgi:hypothetical protein
MLGKYKKLLSWITTLLNVIFLSVDGMNHLRGHEDMIPIVDYFLYIPQGSYCRIKRFMFYQFIVSRYFFNSNKKR